MGCRQSLANARLTYLGRGDLKFDRDRGEPFQVVWNVVSKKSRGLSHNNLKTGIQRVGWWGSKKNGSFKQQKKGAFNRASKRRVEKKRLKGRNTQNVWQPKHHQEVTQGWRKWKTQTKKSSNKLQKNVSQLLMAKST